MHGRPQFDMRENPASDRRHGSRLTSRREGLSTCATEEDKFQLGLIVQSEGAAITSKSAAHYAATVREEKPLEQDGHGSKLLRGQPFESIEPVWNCVEAARFLRLHPKTVKRMARLGQIPGCRLGRRWFFRPSDLDALLRGGVSSSEKANRVAPQLSSNPKRRG